MKKPENTPSTSHKFMGADTILGLNGKPYMFRAWIGRLRYHKMFRGDQDREPHDHPWWFITFPLRSYVEEVLTFKDGVWDHRLNVVRAFRFHFRPARYAHRILGPVFKDVPIGEYYRAGSLEHFALMDAAGIPERERHIRTLVLRGKISNKWGFYNVFIGHEAGAWMPSKEYFASKGFGYQEGRTANAAEDRGRTPA